MVVVVVVAAEFFSSATLLELWRLLLLRREGLVAFCEEALLRKEVLRLPLEETEMSATDLLSAQEEASDFFVRRPSFAANETLLLETLR